MDSVHRESIRRQSDPEGSEVHEPTSGTPQYAKNGKVRE